MNSNLLITATLLVFLLLSGCSVGATAAAENARDRSGGSLHAALGVVTTPRNFPKHTGPDVQDMFARARAVGSFVVVKAKWSEENFARNAENLTLLAETAGLTPILEFTAIEAKKEGAVAELAIPDSLRASGRASFSNPAISDAFVKVAGQLAQLELPYLALSTDVNVLEKVDRAEYAAFVKAYHRAYAEVKRISPKTKVFVTLHWDVMEARGDSRAAAALVDGLRPALDLLAFSSNPWEVFRKTGPGSIPNRYFAGIAPLRKSGDELLVQLSWLSKGRTGNADQLAFIERVPALLEAASPDMLVWNFLHDIRILIFNVEAGLIERDGTVKPSLAAFAALSGSNPPKAASAATRTPASTAPPSQPARSVAHHKPAQFGIYVARLDGGSVKPLITDDLQEMTHARVSPDGKRVTFTRYHQKGKDGTASEDSGYANTSIMLIRVDGTGLETVIPARRGVISSNSSWAPDGRSLIFISTDNSARAPKLMRVDLESRKISRLPTPPDFMTTDPHWEGEHIVFPVKGDGVDSIWLMDQDGKNARQVTHPKKPRNAKKGRFNYGDFDPKLSPDGKQVAFMRFYGATDWRIFVTDVETGKETSLSPKNSIEGLPEWSSDGRLLIFRHLDPKNLPETGLYTMTPKGGERKMLPLPRGYLYKHAGFFPGEGSTKRTRIIYSATQKAGF